jgi:crossover junction endodeoxyribonuclease RuvC
MRKWLGYDPSLTSSGYCFKTDEGYQVGRILPKKFRGAERLDFITEQLLKLVYDHDIEVIFMEGYSMGSPQRGGAVGRAFDIGELGGVVKLLAYRGGVDLVLVPPAVLKKFATGKGNAKKPEMIAAVRKVWGMDIPQDDMADAFLLYQFGEPYLNHRKRRRYKPDIRELFGRCERMKAAPV